MNILVACEESQRVCMAFREKGHRAFSCDVIDCSGGHPEWHIKQNVIPLLNGDCDFITQDGLHHIQQGKWDMIIAFPPCTFLSNAGARFLWKNHKLDLERYYQGLIGKALFMTIYKADCERIVIENPTSSKIFELPSHSQVIQPYEFGHPYTKRTCLWLKNVPPLTATDVVKVECSTKQAGNWFNKGGKARQANRAKTFKGIAKAMAEQWG